MSENQQNKQALIEEMGLFYKCLLLLLLAQAVFASRHLLGLDLLEALSDLLGALPELRIGVP